MDVTSLFLCYSRIPMEPRPLCLGGSMGARKGKSLEVNIECQEW